MAQHFIVTPILAAVRALPGYPRLRVLDLSCGRGEILAALQRDGCAVRGTHYRLDDYEVRSEGSRNLARWMTHPAMLPSEQLLIVARKG